MERYSKSIRRWLLTPVIMIFLAVTFLGCSDPTVLDIKARNQEFRFTIEQELQRSRNASKASSGVVSLPPAQAADMEAERRELDRMVERGDWEGLFN